MITQKCVAFTISHFLITNNSIVTRVFISLKCNPHCWSKMNLNSFVVIISSLNYAACAKNPCYCNKVNVQIEEHGLKLATLLTVDKNGIEDSFVYKADLGNEEYLYLYKKSPNRWEISNDLNHKSNPELFVNCPFNCPQNCKPWQRKEGGGSLQDFKLTATCKGKIIFQ